MFIVTDLVSLTHYVWVSPKWVLLQIVKTKMKCHIMGLHYLLKQKRSSNKNYIFLLYPDTPTPLDIYSGPFHVYCIEPEE